MKNGHLSEKMNAINDTQNSGTGKISKGNLEYLRSPLAFVEAWIKSKCLNDKSSLGKPICKIAQKLSLT